MHSLQTIRHACVKLPRPLSLAEIRVRHEPLVFTGPKHSAKSAHTLLALKLVRFASDVVQDDHVSFGNLALRLVEGFFPVPLAQPRPIHKHSLWRVPPLAVVPQVDAVALEESHDAFPRVALSGAWTSADHKLPSFGCVIERGVFDEPFSGLRQPDNQLVV